ATADGAGPRAGVPVVSRTAGGNHRGDARGARDPFLVSAAQPARTEVPIFAPSVEGGMRRRGLWLLAVVAGAAGGLIACAHSDASHEEPPAAATDGGAAPTNLGGGPGAGGD